MTSSFNKWSLATAALGGTGGLARAELAPLCKQLEYVENGRT
jgi:hypothetical protein